MALIILTNNREHDINICMTDKAGIVQQITIPGSRQNPDDRSRLLKSFIEVEGEFIKEARKRFEAVEHYFRQEWLSIGKPTTLEVKNEDGANETAKA